MHPSDNAPEVSPVYSDVKIGSAAGSDRYNKALDVVIAACHSVIF